MKDIKTAYSLGSRPDHYYQEICMPHVWDIKERVQGGVIEDV